MSAALHGVAYDTLDEILVVLMKFLIGGSNIKVIIKIIYFKKIYILYRKNIYFKKKILELFFIINI